MAINPVAAALFPNWARQPQQTPQPFLWGAGGAKLTPEDIARMRTIGDALRAPQGYVPKGTFDLLGNLAGEAVATLKEKRADDAEKEARKAVSDALAKGDYLGVMADPNAGDGQRTVAAALYQQNTPDAQLERKYKQAQIDALGTKSSGYHVLTADEAAARGLPAGGSYQVGPDGKVDPIGTGSGVNIYTGDGADAALDKALSGKEGELWSTYKQTAATSASNAQDFGVLDQLINVAPQGPITGRLAEAFPGFSSAGDAFNSIVKRIAPTLRAPGSGATSDIEYDGMLRSLPALRNTPEANRMILSIMKAKAEINQRRAEIITAYQARQISVSDARAQMNELDRQSIVTPEMRAALEGIGAGAGAGNGNGPEPGAVEDGYRFKGGDPSDPANWEKV